ncbi:hypothetical protein PVBG_05034 [Plasmodium vivax Brazil I]|uniref:Variable surface protein Vir35 n=1 Tax=Plasmodium vivax (strain Brazil I) TaxID=1033975 RepID=A0A0J9SZM5_PLAV1|nr:hypothetical protein PVBG_05034 [Plasmodium vivax Brazil I]
MKLILKYSLRDNVKFVVLLKFFTYIFLIWNSNNHLWLCDNALEMKFKLVRTFNASFYRLLAKHELKNDLYKTHVRQNYADYGMNKNIKKDTENKSTYSHVKRGGLNELDAYRKGYKQRYSKKKGLAKLDCYCEKKVFDKFNNMCDIAEKLKNNTMRAKKKILKKYGIGLIIFALIPAIGLIFPTLFGDGHMKDIYGLCKEDHYSDPKDFNTHKTDSTYKDCTTKWIYEDQGVLDKIHYANMIFSFIMIIIVVSVIIYILIKFIKYEKIKYGKNK